MAIRYGADDGRTACKISRLQRLLFIRLQEFQIVQEQGEKSGDHLENRGDRPKRNPGRVRWTLVCAKWELNSVGKELSARRRLILM
jgi:hypothetical protein